MKMGHKVEGEDIDEAREIEAWAERLRSGWWWRVRAWVRDTFEALRVKLRRTRAAEEPAAEEPAHGAPVEEFRGALWQGDDPGLACPVPFELFEGTHDPRPSVPRGEHGADVR
ncbi:hypothetical protein [Polyangium sp. 6x1]|uniref:hypothetical protein n=1 Tax=Polyangium sp. 6x1 TaxID=3042689 RepID=UPI002482F302|nr:hypothetical protein [Polyangium sp. 6x1]MDI1451710.1 hypothetical protein [Polyangium sp. 6x1]